MRNIRAVVSHITNCAWERIMRSPAKKNERLSSKSTPYAQISGLILAVFLIVTIIGSAAWIRSYDAEPLQPIMLATGEWAPYSGSNLASFGIASAVVSAVFQEMGFQPEFRFVPWPRAEQSALENETGKGVRATFPYGFNADRDAKYYYFDPIFEIYLSVFFNTVTIPQASYIKNTEDLAGFLVVPISGYRYPPAVEKFFASSLAAENNLKAFKMLLETKEPLVVIEATDVAEELLREPLALEADAIGRSPLRIRSPIHLMASKRNPDNSQLIRDFNEALEKLQRDGTLEQVKARAAEAIDAQRMIRLQPLDGDGSIAAFLDANKTMSILLPHGTQAVIERWSSNYLRAKATRSSTGELARVRLLNGPQRGHSLYVDERSIVLP